MTLSRPQLEILSTLSREELLEFIDLQQKNWWNLQNNWMAYMNAEYGMEAAVKGDCHGLEDDVDALMKAMVLSTIWANGDYDIWKLDDTTFHIRVTNCHQQVRRLEEGMGELACKPAGIAIAETAARAINPASRVRCLVCPPDAHPKDVWCEWEFALPRAS